jgi:Putative peptidoglycan binding domain
MAIFIKNTIRQDSAPNLDDVLKIKTALNSLGHYEIPDYGLTPYPDKKLFNAIKNYQKLSGLKVDGVINPDGETIRKINSDSGYKTDHLHDFPGARTPTIWCPECGGPHGGSAGDLCPFCDGKKS